MKTLIKFSLLAFALVALACVPVQAGGIPGEQWTLSLGGAGVTTTEGDSQSVFGAEIDLGRTGHLLFPVQGGVRQAFSYDSEDGGSALFSTRLYLDATLLKYKNKVDLFAGGNIGLTYGDTEPLWEIAPEAGLRYWLKKDIALVGRVEFPYSISNDRWNDTLKYFLGIQVKF